MESDRDPRHREPTPGCVLGPRDAGPTCLVDAGPRWNPRAAPGPAGSGAALAGRGHSPPDTIRDTPHDCGRALRGNSWRALPAPSRSFRRTATGSSPSTSTAGIGAAGLRSWCTLFLRMSASGSRVRCPRWTLPGSNAPVRLRGRTATDLDDLVIASAVRGLRDLFLRHSEGEAVHRSIPDDARVSYAAR